MDLLRTVLQICPIDRILDLWEEDHELINQKFFLDRLRRVNHLENGVISEIQRLVHSYFPTSYPEVCILQGELSIANLTPVDQRWIACRAAFLGDHDVYRRLPMHTIPNIGLRSPSLEIRQVTAIECRDSGDILDPASIVWNPVMKAAILRKASQLFSAPVAFLVGYLSYPNFDTNQIPSTANRGAFFAGYVEAAMVGVTDHFALRPELEIIGAELLIGAYLTSTKILAEYGCFAYVSEYQYVTISLLHLWPELLRKGLRSSGSFLAVVRLADTDYVSIGMNITEVIVKRARRMLDLEKEEDMDIFSPFYRTFLRILLGMPVDLTDFDDDKRDTLVTFMMRVAHPQLTGEMVVGRSTLFRPSVVLYDLVNYFRIHRGGSIPLGSADDHKLQSLFACGQAIRIRDTPLFRKLYIGD